MRYIFLVLLVFSALTGAAQQLKLVLPTGHSSNVSSMQFSRDGKLAITCDRTQVKTWESATGRMLMNLDFYSDDIMKEDLPWYAQFSPDGKLVYVGMNEGGIRIYNAISGALVKKIHTSLFAISNIQFSPDGKIMAVSSVLPDVIILNAVTGDSLATLATGKRVKSVQFSRDGNFILTASGDGMVRLWKTSTRKLHREYPNEYVTSASLSNDGKLIATTGYDTSISIWDASNGVLKKTIPGLKYGGLSVAFSPDDKRILVTEEEATEPVIFDVETGKLVWHLWAHTDNVTWAGYSADGKFIGTASEDGSARIWDAPIGWHISDLKGSTRRVEKAVFSKDGKKILTYSTKDNQAKLWDAYTGSWITGFSSNDSHIFSADISEDQRYIITGSHDGTVALFNPANGVKEKMFPAHDRGIFSARISPDNQVAATVSYDSTIKLWAIPGGKLLHTIRYMPSLMRGSAEFSHDSKKLVTTGKGFEMTVWDVASGKPLQKIPLGSKYGNEYAEFSPDDTHIVFTDLWNVCIADVTTGKIVQKFALRNIKKNVHYSRDGKNVLVVTDVNTIKILDALTGKLVKEVGPHESMVIDASFSPDGKRVISTSWDNTVKVWDIDKASLQYTFLELGKEDYLVHLPNNYYRSSPGAAKLLHYVTTDRKVVTFEQLDVKYNRPDMVLKALGNSDTSLISSYFLAYQKRQKKLGLDINDTAVVAQLPEADFVGRGQYDLEQSKKTLTVRIHAQDPVYPLDHFNVWINEVPLFGAAGIKLQQRQSRTFDTALDVTITEGTNILETSVTNSKGLESYRMPLTLKGRYLPEATDKLYFIGIGIDRFADTGHPLKYCVKDIRDLAARLAVKYKAQIIIDTLFNEQVNIQNIVALKQRLLSTAYNDKVIVAYSGHGLLSKNYDYYLSTYAVNFEHPEVNGLPYEILESLVDSIPARRKLMLIDACHSGEVDKEEIAKYKREAGALDANGVKPKGFSLSRSPGMGMKNSFELMQQLFVNVGRNTGTTIISAAAGTQLAQESKELLNGVFTYSILEYMEAHPSCTVNQLREYVNKRVPELTRGLQVPTARAENQVDWNIW